MKSQMRSGYREFQALALGSKKPVLRAKKQMKRAIEKHNADYLIGLAAQRPFGHGLSSMRPLKRNHHSRSFLQIICAFR